MVWSFDSGFAVRVYGFGFAMYTLNVNHARRLVPFRPMLLGNAWLARVNCRVQGLGLKPCILYPYPGPLKPELGTQHPEQARASGVVFSEERQ